MSGQHSDPRLAPPPPQSSEGGERAVTRDTTDGCVGATRVAAAGVARGARRWKGDELRTHKANSCAGVAGVGGDAIASRMAGRGVSKVDEAEKAVARASARHQSFDLT